jgi:hypothetical protein
MKSRRALLLNQDRHVIGGLALRSNSSGPVSAPIWSFAAKISAKKFFFPVDAKRERATFSIPPEAGLQRLRDRRGGFSQILGLQIGTQFCPGMMHGNVNHSRSQD